MPSAMAGAAREGAIRSPPPSARAPPPSSIAGAARVGVAGEGRQPAQEHWRRRHGGQRRNARSRARCDVQRKKAIHRATRVISIVFHIFGRVKCPFCPFSFFSSRRFVLLPNLFSRRFSRELGPAPAPCLRCALEAAAARPGPWPSEGFPEDPAGCTHRRAVAGVHVAAGEAPCC